MSNLDDFGKVQTKSAGKQAPPPLKCEGESDKSEERKEVHEEQWAEVRSNTYQACGPTKNILPSGAYRFGWFNGNITYIKVPLIGDNLLDFEDSVFSKVVDEIENFWRLENIFNRFGFLHKRGYLFYGPAGSGKSCLVQRIIHDVFKKNGIAFLCSTIPDNIEIGLRCFRALEEKRHVVCVFEDLDTIIDQYGEDAVLSLLDGEANINHVINLATTNYPEKLDKRIVSRPRRFDQVLKINMPNEKMREKYFINKLYETNGGYQYSQEQKDELAKWVKTSEGFSFASMAELVVGVKCLGNDLQETSNRLKSLINKKHKSDEEFENIGF